MPPRIKKPRTTATPLAEALQSVGAKPADMLEDGKDNRAAKKNWAQNLSNALATTLAAYLRPAYPAARVTPNPDGTAQEFRVGGGVDRKRTNVGIWDDAAGLIAGVSIKTYSFRDYHGPKDGKPARLGGLLQHRGAAAS